MKELESFDRQFKTQVDKITIETILKDSSSKVYFAIELT